MPRTSPNAKSNRIAPNTQTREQWAHRHGGKPLSVLLCYCDATVGAHVHSRHVPAMNFPVDENTGRWIQERDVNP